MAAVGSKRKRLLLNYKDLNEISSVVLFDIIRCIQLSPDTPFSTDYCSSECEKER